MPHMPPSRWESPEVERQDAPDAKRIFEPSPALDRLAHSVIGGAIEVHRTLGPGFLENVYEEAMAIELGLRGFSVARQVPLPLLYKGRSLPGGQLDLLVEDELVVELKAIQQFSAIHPAQLHSYLRAGNYHLGLLINFNVPVLHQGLRRVINSRVSPPL
jgi:GxxExxY protein